MSREYPVQDVNAGGQLKRRRFPLAGDELERHRLEALGYVFRGVTRSGKHQIMVLMNVSSTNDDKETTDAIKTRFEPERRPQSPDELVGRLRLLHNKRALLPRSEPRRSLNAKQRKYLLEKTGSQCHLCRCALTGNRFVADHVRSHKSGGKHELANYLPAHSLCNGKRWFYSPEEFQWILTIGVWARKQIEDQKTPTSKGMLRAFWNRPKRKKKDAAAHDLRNANIY